MRAELESLRRRHTSALELMGERDEEVTTCSLSTCSLLFFQLSVVPLEITQRPHLLFESQKGVGIILYLFFM